jgi:hypothetical protein
MREPDFEGMAGRAWRIDIRPEDRVQRDQDASLAGWHMHCPHAHPFWSWYMVTLIHLRDLPGMSKLATKNYPEASHEVVVMSLNPDHPLREPGRVQHPLNYLVPFDHVIQFDGTNDEQAVHVIELYVRACVDGHISPDQDYRQAWKDMMRRTIEHVVTGGHSS